MRTVSLSVAGLMLLTACAGPATGDLEDESSPIAHYDWDEGAAMQALLEGTLALQDGCLVVTGAVDDDFPPTVPVFSRSHASWDADAQTLTYAGRDYGLGDQIWAGGGGVEIANVDITLPDACVPFAAEGWVFLVQDTDLEPYQP